ncbi:diguanylate cyclase domain-containing protein [Novosphingobium sp. B 225]|uniref:diguanylate cyclase domain-containing protein n=1 Tax=Novosphingobium sp. B 225 TaxID=1961849 RepID=UPI000B4B739F|nr:diguanylate cyclase [Novosphingobium sp. B 225]
MQRVSPNQALPTLSQLLARVHLRLILFSVVLAALSLLVSGTIVIRNYASRNLDLVAKTVAYTVEPAVVFGDKQAVAEGIASVGAVNGIDRVAVLDPQGQVLAEWRHPHGDFHSRIEDAANRFIWPKPAVATISRNDTAIGRIEIYGNSEGILRYALSGLIISLSCLGLTVIATRILARRLQQDVIAPLDHVAEVAHAVRSDRAFERRVPSSGIAEIDRFGRDFNALLAELQGWHAGLTSENAELARRATHDALTGLGNRVLFEQTLADAIGQSVRSGQSFAVLYFDIDSFKQINDRHGHECGDSALIAVAERLRQSIRQADHAFRLGGDEFAVVLAAFADQASISAVLERVDRAMAQPYRLPTGASANASLSAGVAVYPDDGVSPQDLLRRADANMYQAKKDRALSGAKGKNHA